ncbi:MAG: hypothetical protein RLZZ436_2294 [Planctomycetota bacterium]|jgi:hypothetical protein
MPTLSPAPLLLSVLLAAIIPPASGTLFARTPQGDEKNSAAEKSDKPPKAPKTFSAADQQATLDFIREHHPELSHLLEQLQKSRPEEFRSALRELVPQTQAILRMRDRLPSRYPAQLAAWKRDSQIRLLMARWSRSKDPQIEAQVRELIAQRQQDRKSELQAEQERLNEQLLKLHEQLKALDGEPQQLISAEWEQLARKASAAARSTKTPAQSKTKPPGRPAKTEKPAAPDSPAASPAAPATSPTQS